MVVITIYIVNTLLYISNSTSKVCHDLNYTFLRGKPNLSLQKEAIENHAFFFFFFNQGELLVDTLTQTSLSMHHSLFQLGVVATELALASLNEDSNSQVLLELESQ
jgi:hypothetical protein